MNKEVTLAEMAEALSGLSDDDVFRWYQTSSVNDQGVPVAGDALYVTMGEVRRRIAELQVKRFEEAGIE